MRSILALLLLLLLPVSVLAQTTLVLLDNGPDTTISLIITSTQRVGVEVRAFVSYPIRSLIIQGNGRTIATCLSQSCDYFWPNSSMRSGTNELFVYATTPTGQQASTSTKVIKP